MSLELYAAYVLACAVIALVPGPTVTVIVANSLAHGARDGWMHDPHAGLLGSSQAGLVRGVLAEGELRDADRRSADAIVEDDPHQLRQCGGSVR